MGVIPTGFHPGDGRLYGLNDAGWAVGSWTFHNSSGASRTLATLWDGVAAESILLGTFRDGSYSVARVLVARVYPIAPTPR